MNANSKPILAPLADGMDLLSRLALAALFLWSGWDKVVQSAMTIAYMKAYGMPMAEALAWVAAIFELGTGLLLGVGWRARWAALALAIFTVVVALIFHRFWTAPPEQAVNQAIHFMKNIAIAGGLLHVAAHGAGRFAMRPGQ